MAEREQLTYEDLVQLVELIKSFSQFSEFRLKVGDIEIELRRPSASRGNEWPAEAPAPAASHQRQGHVGGGELVTELAPAPSSPAPHPEPLAYPPGSVLIKSPMVGTFYRSPEPGARPFVEVGERVAPDKTVCIIEVMKLMNSIPAGHPGVVTHILVEDAQPVEYGQVLMVIDPGA